MANNFQRGDQTPVKFQATGLPNSTTLNVTSQNLDHTILLFDVTHTGFAGTGTARIAGKPDVAGTINADFDADAPPYLSPPNILPGVGGIVLYFVTPNKPIQIPMRVEKLHFEQAVTSQVKYSFDVKMDLLQGVMVYPALPGA